MMCTGKLCFFYYLCDNDGWGEFNNDALYDIQGMGVENF
jgi:hypothetical protein